MRRRAILALLLMAMQFAKTMAQDAPVFPKGEIGKNTDNYTGSIWLNELNHPDSVFNISLAQAVYAPGSKLDWHIHPAGQYLLITDGEGYYQERGKNVRLVRKGEVVPSMPGVEQWHGATPQSGFTYMAVTPIQKGKTVWKARVTDSEYMEAGARIAVTEYDAATEQQITRLSKQKWNWMADKKVDSLDALFHAKAMFVHMGGSWGKAQELNVIKSGGIWYKKADVYNTTVNMIGNTAIVLNDIDLLAVVGGNEVTHAFMVTEVYNKENSEWKLGSLTFSQLLRPVKMKGSSSH